MERLKKDYDLSPKQAHEMIQRNSAFPKTLDSVYKLVYRKKGFAIKTPDGVRISVSAVRAIIREKKYK